MVGRLVEVEVENENIDGKYDEYGGVEVVFMFYFRVSKGENIYDIGDEDGLGG